MTESPEAIAALLDAGADLNAKDDDGTTPLHLAADVLRLRGAALLYAALDGRRRPEMDPGNWTVR